MPVLLREYFASQLLNKILLDGTSVTHFSFKIKHFITIDIFFNIHFHAHVAKVTKKD